MEPTDCGADDLTRLKSVQGRVRSLAKNPWIADAFRVAFPDFLTLSDRFRAQKSAVHATELRLARELLAQGWLHDPKARDNSPCLVVRVEGLCPVALDDRIQDYRYGQGPSRPVRTTRFSGEAMPEELERECAAVALAALDRDAIFRAPELPGEMAEAMGTEYAAALAAGTHTKIPWEIVLSRPADWVEPADPNGLNPAELARFPKAELLTIALYRLGGLADLGAVTPLVPEPAATGDEKRDTREYAAWRARLPIHHLHRDQRQPALVAKALPPDIAEQLLSVVEAWAEGEAATRVKSLYASTNRDNTGIGGKDTDWNDVQRRLLAKRARGDTYTGDRPLGRELGCSPATIKKAIKVSELLKGWKARTAGLRAAPKAASIGTLLSDRMLQKKEMAPDDILPDDDVDAAMARLIDQARPEERAKLNALDAAGRRELVATYHAQYRDVEPSPLEPNKPGKRPHRVNAPKRA